jgi:NADPH:quinone reductase-like Zn-dependent oxidoreductase
MTRTVVAEGYGGPEVLALPDIDAREPGPGEVLVDVRTAGADPIDYKLYSGEMGSDPHNLPMPIGLEAAGVIAAYGPGARGYTGPLTVGDEVIVTNVEGGYSERLIAAAAEAGHKPASLSFEEAAGLLLVGGTAWHLLTKTDVGVDDTVLIHGASGGVGLMAVQLATIAGFGRAGELGIAPLTRAEGGQEIRDAARAPLLALAAEGKLEVTVDKVFSLAEAPEAHRYLQTGHARGKVVLVP